MEGTIPFTAIAAGLCSGSRLGASMITNTEREQRGKNRWQPFFPSSAMATVLNEIVRIVLVGTVVAVVAITILSVGNAYPLSNVERIALGFSWVIGVGAAKWLRFLFWRSNA